VKAASFLHFINRIFMKNELSPGLLSRYIESNPVAACLVNNPVDWPWSSAGKEDFTK